jgi:hypothetical protein
MNNNPLTSGSTNPNLLETNSRGIYWNSIDSDAIDRTSYFSAFTGQSITITMSQTGSTAIYSGDTNSLKQWVTTGDTGFVFGTMIGVPPLNIPSGNAILIQSASTQWTIGVPVYISVVVNTPVTPTPTPTATPEATPSGTTTPTPTVTTTPEVTPTSTVPVVTPSSSPTFSGFTLTVTEVGPDVVWSGSGSFDLTDLIFTQSTPGGGGFNAPLSLFGCGPDGSVDVYSGDTFVKSESFGSGISMSPPDTSLGNLFGVFQIENDVPQLVVPSGYVSKSSISGSSTYSLSSVEGHE